MEERVPVNPTMPQHNDTPGNRLLKYVLSRAIRGWSLFSVGPNEARLLFDSTVALVAAMVAYVYSMLFLPLRPPLYAIPLSLCALVAANGLAGIYSRFRVSSGRTKAVVLLATSLASVLLLGVLGLRASFTYLWFVLACPTMILARLFLNLPYSRRRNLAVRTVRQRGPVLVIGGAGYIGTHVVQLLLNNGQAVRVLDRLMYGRQSLDPFLGNRRLELIEGDATDIACLTRAMQGSSTVIHLAGLVGDPACAVDPDFTRHTNIIATRMAREVAESLSVYRFIFASSCSVYGASDHEMTERDPVRPVSLYAQTKVDSERELLFSTPDNFFVTVLRFATVFGHSRRPRFDLVANLFVGQAMTDGIITVVGPHQWRPFIHVRDLARALVLTSEADPALVQNQVFNVGDERLNMTILDLAETVQRVLQGRRRVDITIEDNPVDKRNYRVAFSKIVSLLGFRATTLMEEGIREIADAFENGTYNDYRQAGYSNLAMTRRALEMFYDPSQAARLYAPRIASASSTTVKPHMERRIAP